MADEDEVDKYPGPMVPTLEIFWADNGWIIRMPVSDAGGPWVEVVQENKKDGPDVSSSGATPYTNRDMLQQIAEMLHLYGGKHDKKRLHITLRKGERL